MGLAAYGGALRRVAGVADPGQSSFGMLFVRNWKGAARRHCELGGPEASTLLT